jgi:hypothetical protein
MVYLISPLDLVPAVLARHVLPFSRTASRARILVNWVEAVGR